ncbi:MAG: putative bifunctional diguanylate cyclase/phosphodiesterase [Rhodothalassiaceae bacterium]
MQNVNPIRWLCLCRDPDWATRLRAAGLPVETVTATEIGAPPDTGPARFYVILTDGTDVPPNLELLLDPLNRPAWLLDLVLLAQPGMTAAAVAERLGATDLIAWQEDDAQLSLRCAALKRRARRHAERQGGLVRSGAGVDRATGLPTLDLLRPRLKAETLFKREGLDGTHTALILIDLERFSRIATAFGRAGADRVLAETGARLNGSVQTLALEGLLTRWGKSHHHLPTLMRINHDCFALILPGLAQPGLAERIARRLLAAMTPVILLSDRPVYVTARAGIACAPDDGTDLDTLLHRAQAALDEAKQARQRSGSDITFYSASGEALQAEGVALESRLRRAMEQGELGVHFQPQVGMTDKTVMGVEALVRWHAADLGQVSPDRLVQVAKAAGLLPELGQYMVRESIRQVKALERRGLRPLKLSVNITADMLETHQLTDFIGRQLRQRDFPPERLMLELTESLVIDDPDRAIGIISGLKALQVRLALDDFGTGYSSLSYLKALPFDCLKIDKSFVADIGRSEEDQGVLRAIIAMGQTMGMILIAEGVETTEQRDWLRREGCHFYQGFLCAPPLTPEQLLEGFGNTAGPLEGQAGAR